MSQSEVKHSPLCFIHWCLQGHGDILNCQRLLEFQFRKFPHLDFLCLTESTRGEGMGERVFFSQASFLTQACGLTDPVVSWPAGQVIFKGLLPGHLATPLGSDAAAVLTQLPANPKPLCLHLDVQITLFKTFQRCLPLSQLPRL